MFNAHESSDLLLDELDTTDDALDELEEGEGDEEKLDTGDAWDLEEGSE